MSKKDDPVIKQVKITVEVIEKKNYSEDTVLKHERTIRKGDMSYKRLMSLYKNTFQSIHQEVVEDFSTLVDKEITIEFAEKQAELESV